MSAETRQKKAWEKRQAAARGEKTSISAIGWMRIVWRSLGLLALLIVFVPMHYL